MLDKIFSHQSVEGSIYKKWEASGAFKAGHDSNREPFSMMMPPPNVTGNLHLGHALTYTLPDILARFQRMRGRDVLWQPGTDHAGISTQIMVERQLASEGTSRKNLGREAFVERTWQWKHQYGDLITQQLRKLGVSPDWSRERFTMDEGLSHAVRRIFVQLYQEGLIYRDKRLVNWDPKLETAISDLEVENREVEGAMFYINYPVVGTENQTITVATTRPETLFGDVAIAVHPENEKYLHLVGGFVHLPLTHRSIPVIADIHADPEKGTGAVKITPAHDFNDFEVGKRHQLDFINVFDSKACLNENVPQAYQGLERFGARKKVLEGLASQGLLLKEEKVPMVLPYGEKSGVIIEPWLMDQWYVDAAALAKPAIQAVEEGRIKFVPHNWSTTYFEWLRNIQPWCISRQLWWGHRIPVWYGPDRQAFAAISEEEALAEAKSFYGRDVTLVQEEDVLDTWFSSGLWPFSTLGWPEVTPELKKYYPTDLLITGFDIIFFWVARMIMLGLHFMKDVPFRTVYIHALIRDEKGQKMSKTKGNVIDPIEVINSYGADALRFTLASLTSAGRDIKFSKTHVESSRNFVTKLWNTARFCEMHECKVDPHFSPAAVQFPLNQWITTETSDVIGRVTAAIEAFKFNEATTEIYQFVWGTFCDWYLEFAKPHLVENTNQKEEIQKTAAWVLEQVVHVLHPFMPFVTEALWSHFQPSAGCVMETPWPLPGKTRPEAVHAQEDINWIISLISEVRKLRAELNIPPAVKMPLEVYEAEKVIQERVKTFENLICHLARLEKITVSAESLASDKLKGSVQGMVSGATFILPLKGAIDIDTEKTRLEKELGKVRVEIGKIELKLNNQDFVTRAPRHVIEENQSRLAQEKEAANKLMEAITRLWGG